MSEPQTTKTTREHDPRSVSSGHPKAVLCAYVGGWDMGGWTDDDDHAFMREIALQAADGIGGDPADWGDLHIYLAKEGEALHPCTYEWDGNGFVVRWKLALS